MSERATADAKLDGAPQQRIEPNQTNQSGQRIAIS